MTTETARDKMETAWDIFDDYNPEKDGNDEYIDVDPRCNSSYTKEQLLKLSNENRLWTVVTGDDGFDIPVKGYHYVNRLSHHICSIPYKEESDD